MDLNTTTAGPPRQAIDMPAPFRISSTVVTAFAVVILSPGLLQQGVRLDALDLLSRCDTPISDATILDNVFGISIGEADNGEPALPRRRGSMPSNEILLLIFCMTALSAALLHMCLRRVPLLESARRLKLPGILQVPCSLVAPITAVNAAAVLSNTPVSAYARDMPLAVLSIAVVCVVPLFILAYGAYAFKKRGIELVPVEYDDELPTDTDASGRPSLCTRGWRWMTEPSAEWVGDEPILRHAEFAFEPVRYPFWILFDQSSTQLLCAVAGLGLGLRERVYTSCSVLSITATSIVGVQAIVLLYFRPHLIGSDRWMLPFLALGNLFLAIVETLALHGILSDTTTTASNGVALVVGFTSVFASAIGILTLIAKVLAWTRAAARARKRRQEQRHLLEEAYAAEEQCTLEQWMSDAAAVLRRQNLNAPAAAVAPPPPPSSQKTTAAAALRWRAARPTATAAAHSSINIDDYLSFDGGNVSQMAAAAAAEQDEADEATYGYQDQSAPQYNIDDYLTTADAEQAGDEEERGAEAANHVPSVDDYLLTNDETQKPAPARKTAALKKKAKFDLLDYL